MQFLIYKEFNKFIILRVLLCQVFVALLALKFLLSCLTTLKILRYVASLIY